MNPQLFMFLSSFTSYVVAQGIKLFHSKKKEHTVKEFLIRRGGFFSAHSAALISALSAIFIIEGFSTSFLIVLLFSLMVYSDIIRRGKRSPQEVHSLSELLRGGLLGLGITTIYYFFGFIVW